MRIETPCQCGKYRDDEIHEAGRLGAHRFAMTALCRFEGCGKPQNAICHIPHEDNDFCFGTGKPNCHAFVAASPARVPEAKEDEYAGFDGFVRYIRERLTVYPQDVFTGASGDKGPVFIAAIYNALDRLESK